MTWKGLTFVGIKQKISAITVEINVIALPFSRVVTQNFLVGVKRGDIAKSMEVILYVCF